MEEEPRTFISEEDKHKLTLLKMNKMLAQANVEKTLAQNELADLSYKYSILQLYLKYGLLKEDSISENGEIVKAKKDE